MTCSDLPGMPTRTADCRGRGRPGLAAHGISEVPNDRGLGLVAQRDDSPLPDGYVIPEPYIIAPDGVHLVKDDGAGYARVAWAWLFPIRVYVDPDGDQLVGLAWRDGPRWVTRLIRRSLTKSGRKLIAEAGDAGLPMIEAEAKQAERWLAAAETANRTAIARHPVARQLGWQADGKTFVTTQDTPWRIEPRYSDQAGALAAYRPEGTLAGWQETIKGIEEYPVVRAGVYAGLAAPLLTPRPGLVCARLLGEVEQGKDDHGGCRAELLGRPERPGRRDAPLADRQHHRHREAAEPVQRPGRRHR